ncbi:MAG: ABC transporter permease [Rubrobacter sp.]|nr:ABC transporter permease [Rubrobacter sp.]
MSAYTSTTYTSGTKGPIEAVTSSLTALYQRRWLAIYFAQRELSKAYRGSYLGFLWALLSPLVMIILLTVVFSEIVGIRFRQVTGDSSLNFGLFLYCGLIPFLAFSDALNRSSTAVRANSSLVQKVVFPLEILPLAKALTIQIDKVFGVGVLILVVAIMEQRLQWTVLLLPLLIAIQLVFTVGLSFLMAVIGTYLPDVKGFSNAFVRMMFFASPIIWPAGRVPDSLSFVVDLNPLAYLITAYRALVLEGTLPDLTWTLWFSMFAIALLVGAFALFARVKQNFADLI